MGLKAGTYQTYQTTLSKVNISPDSLPNRFQVTSSECEFIWF